VDTLLFASGNALVQFSPMLIIPILVPLMTQQLGASQDLLPWLFFGGGVTGYLSTKITGALTSRFSALILATGSTFVFILSLLIPILGYPHAALFITLFLGASYSRLVSSSAVTIQFPDDRQRAGFSSLQTSIMYLVTTAAFFLSAFLLPGHVMASQNINTLLAVCAIFASGFPIIVIILQKKLAKRTFQPDHLIID
jgi:predicted MFS family arabinose efflux permease